MNKTLTHRTLARAGFFTDGDSYSLFEAGGGVNLKDVRVRVRVRDWRVEHDATLWPKVRLRESPLTEQRPAGACRVFQKPGSLTAGRPALLLNRWPN